MSRRKRNIDPFKKIDEFIFEEELKEADLAFDEAKQKLFDDEEFKYSILNTEPDGLHFEIRTYWDHRERVNLVTGEVEFL